MRICDFSGSHPLGAPKNWDQALDGPCGVLPVAREVDLQSGMPVMYSLWRPEPEELLALQNGGAVRLGILGGTHPVVNMAVLTPESCAAAAVVEFA